VTPFGAEEVSGAEVFMAAVLDRRPLANRIALSIVERTGIMEVLWVFQH
jgi:hypothetical protein